MTDPKQPNTSEKENPPNDPRRENPDRAKETHTGPPATKTTRSEPIEKK